MIEEIETLTCSPLANKLKPKSKTMDKLGVQYGLSKDTIARYLRVFALEPRLKAKLDSGEIALRTAVALSYLRKDEQEMIVLLLSQGYKVSMKQAEMLRVESEKGEIGVSCIKGILSTISESPLKKPRTLKVSDQLFSQYFSDEQSVDEIEDIVSKALEMFFSKMDE